MALSIRLTRAGRRKSPYYRLVVADKRSPRDGRFIEILGHYHPLRGNDSFVIKEDRALHWLNVGAQPSETARSLLRKRGVMRKWHEGRVAAKKESKSGDAASVETGEETPAAPAE